MVADGDGGSRDHMPSRPHKLDYHTFLGSGVPNPGAAGYSGYYCKGCGKSVVSKPGSSIVRHGDFQVYAPGNIPK